MTATTDDRPTTIKVWATLGDDGVLKLDVAPGYYEIVLTRTEKELLPPHPSWPPEFLKRTAGSIPDMPDCDEGFRG